MCEANKAIGREKHLMPTLDDLIADLNGAAVFSTLDLASGYHQLTLAPESRHITTFSTHVGLRRYKRLIFDINAASEIFQNAVAELLAGLPGCKNISDDIIVNGKDQLEHDFNLQAVLQRLSDYNVRLNKDKCHFSQSQCVSMVISSAPNESKPILGKTTPSNKPALLKTSAKLSLCLVCPNTSLDSSPTTLPSLLHYVLS
jgi:hypothetical protein